MSTVHIPPVLSQNKSKRKPVTNNLKLIFNRPKKEYAIGVIITKVNLHIENEI